MPKALKVDFRQVACDIGTLINFQKGEFAFYEDALNEMIGPSQALGILSLLLDAAEDSQRRRGL